MPPVTKTPGVDRDAIDAMKIANLLLLLRQPFLRSERLHPGGPPLRFGKDGDR